MDGGCHCGAVRFRAGALRPTVTVCHCGQCRAWSGHAWAATRAQLSDFTLLRDAGLRWVRSSDAARRGFCTECGARLFWQPEGGDHIAIAVGALDDSAGLEVTDHIFTEDAGDYYAPEGPPPPASAPPPDAIAGACLCGGVVFAVTGAAGPVTACHCTQCRRLSGHFAASFDLCDRDLRYSARDSLATYRTAGGGTRGFCTGCGSSLWFRAPDGALSVEAGCLRAPTGGRLAAHIFTAERGSYYVLDDGLPHYPGAGPD